jgi:superfamily II DNA or RNA helicase
VARFITNQNQLLKDLLETYIPCSIQLDFLVGFFYFSGFTRIYNKIGEQKLRILVGMEADVDIHNAIWEKAYPNGGKINSPSNLRIRQEYYRSLENIIGSADSLDTRENEKAFRFFIEKLKSGTLEVRKTRAPNHAKMYIFTADDAHSFNGQEPGRVIVGSSNLSFQGLEGRTEVNVLLGGPAVSEYDEAAGIFNKLWDESIPLADDSTKEEFLETVIKRTWLEHLPSPYLIYIRILHEYFKTNAEGIKTPAGLTHNKDTQYMNLAYQTDAINEGIAMIKRHSGCIVADVVGLGKSIIGAAIAANLDIKTIIICPPHLKTQWEDFAFDFGLASPKIISSGKLEDALAFSSGPEEKLIIVDEAHRYRNEDTRDYGLLHRICIGNKVLLLSATPFNNRPEDIFSLIKLFQIPLHSTIQIVNNLGAAMERIIIDYKKLKKEQRQGGKEAEFKKKTEEISSKIRNILQPVLIRRTRVDLVNDDIYSEDLKKQNIVFSEVKPPEEQEYDLGAMSDLYLDTLKQLTGAGGADRVFSGARYQPLMYLKDDEKIIEKYRKIFDNPNPKEGQRNMAIFMRRLLVRRFESSIYSFKKTLANIITSMNNIKKWHDGFKKIPLYKKSALPDFDRLEEMINEELENALFVKEFEDILNQKLNAQIEKGIIMVNADELTTRFINDLENDIALFNNILEKWESPQYNDDPKFNGILEKIQVSLQKEPKRKIIIFSEFMDTVDYLEEKLKEKKLRVIKYTSKTYHSKNMIKANFDAGYKPENQENDYDVLVATDAISEGFSLHRAGTIYNYDIPYNPTRVIQRVGRINRINKKVFDRLNIYNFFPSATGEALSRTKSIATFKILLIQSIFGSDTKILTADEITKGYLDEEFRKAKAELESPSWETEYRNELCRIEKNDREALKKALELPRRCRTGRKAGITEDGGNAVNVELFTHADKKGVLVFSQKGDAYRFSFCAEIGNSGLVSAQEGIALFKAGPEEAAVKLTDSFYPLYEKTKDVSAADPEKTALSKNISNLNNKIHYLLRQSKGNVEDMEYFSRLQNIAVKLRALPLFYIRMLLDVDIKDTKAAAAEFKALVNEEYINTILEKDDKIVNETETILLAEQFI